MQFFDRPSRAKIALRGSSSRAPTSQELLTRAKKAREQRARHRRHQLAATHLQSVYRQRTAVRQLVQHFTHVEPATQLRPAVIRLLLLAGVLNAPQTSLSRNIHLVRLHVAARPFLPLFARQLAALVADPAHSTSLHDLPESIIVKTVVVLLALIAHLSEQPVNQADVDHLLVAVAYFVRRLTSASLLDQAQWGMYIHAADVLSKLASCDLYQQSIPVLRDIIYFAIQLADDEQPSTPASSIVFRQFAMSLFPVPSFKDHVPLTDRLPLMTHIMCSIAKPEEAQSEQQFQWDMAYFYSSLSVKEAGTMLSNLLDMGDHLWRSRENSSLWAYLTVLSFLIQLLPTGAVDYDDSDDDEAMAIVLDDCGDFQTKGSMRSLFDRLRTAFRKIVSDDIVRNVFGTAAAEGHDALIRTCQFFNFLIRRHRSLRDPFLGALAFWRGSREAGNTHILKTLWENCKKQRAENMQSPEQRGDVAVSLSEEATPILSVFVSVYAYFLFIQDADELFEVQWPFSVDEVREIAQVLKQCLFAALYIVPLGRTRAGGLGHVELLKKEPNVLQDIARLLSRLHACDSQRPFRTNDDFWPECRGVLTSDAFLQDAIEAGPNALTNASDSSSKANDKFAISSGIKVGSVTGAGELLRVAPYLVPFSARAKIFQSWIARERDMANGGHAWFPSQGRTVSVRRKSIFEDAFQELSGSVPDLKATIRVKFIDEHGLEEAGIDGGGVFKEFMYEVLRLGFSPYLYGLFKANPEGRLYPNPDAPVANENFRTQFAFLGRMLGKAVFDGVTANVPLASFFLSKLLGQFNYPIDLGSLDPELYKNMKFLKNCPPGTVEDLGLNFTVANNAYGTTDEVELVKNGSNIAVTAANRIEYLHRVANYRMNTQIKEQCTAFMRGFSEVVPSQFIRLFSREELQLLISGKTGKIDLDDLRRNTNYSGGYGEQTPVIQWFWQAMEELDPEQQSKMLQFVTSSPRAPLLGFSYLVPTFCIHRAEGHVRLPTASTCMNLLKLPQYKSLDVVREKLRYALESNAGFNLS